MPIGKGVVLMGMGERTTRQAVFQVAAQLFQHEAATRVIACLMPKSRAAMHLDTVFSFCDRDLCTAFRDVADQIKCYSARPAPNGHLEVREDRGSIFDVVKDALGLRQLRIVETAATRGRPSASNGTTATMSSPCRQGWSSVTTATRTPIRCCAERASK
jgi:arginine deiminase